MENFTIISYSGLKDNYLLSLNEGRSRYMLPFGGRFRVVDFTIQNSISCGAKKTIIYNNWQDDLEDYAKNYIIQSDDDHSNPVKMITHEFSDVNFFYNLILDSNTTHYIIYNGDNPAIIDFGKIVEKYKKLKSSSVLFNLKTSEKTSMAYTVLVTRQKTIMDVIKKAIDYNREAPNVFEMIINIMINKGIARHTIHTDYWPLKNIPDYYNINMDILKNERLFSLVHKHSMLRSFIRKEKFAHIGVNGKISNSFLSDSCSIEGTVENSIIFPGVEIGENSVIRNSIILPYVKIGRSSYITKTIIDESTAPADPLNQSALNVGHRCRIGTDTEQLKNNDFPLSIYQSITLIGKNCVIPDESKIGGACYVASGKGSDYFQKSKYLYDGLSIVK